MRIEVLSTDPLTIRLDDEGRRFLRANIREAMTELGEDEYDTRTGFTLAQAREVVKLLGPGVGGA